MPIPFAFPGDDVFHISIGFDADFREYRATFINRNYGIHLSAPTVSRLKHRTMHLLRFYFGIADEKVVFRNAVPRSGRLASAA